MKFSIITVCRNVGTCLEKTIQSVAQQTYGDREYIILDGQSEDNTQALVQPYIRTEVNDGVVTTFISEPDHGIYDAMNKALDLVTGDVVYFLNADDTFVDAGVLSDVAQFWTQHPDTLILYGNIDLVAQHDQSVSTITYPNPDDLLDHLTFGWICHQALFIKTECFQRIGQFNTQYQIAADYHWLLRAVAELQLGYSASGIEREKTFQIPAHSSSFSYYPRTISRYTLGGVSDAKQVQSLTEIFTIQNQFYPYQTAKNLAQRLGKLQDFILQLKTQEQRQKSVREQEKQQADINAQKITQLKSEINQKGAELQAARAEIEAMESSKFWKLRSLWFKLKALMGKT